MVKTKLSKLATKGLKLVTQAGIEQIAVELLGFEQFGSSLTVQDQQYYATKAIDYALDDGPDKNYGSEELVQ